MSTPHKTYRALWHGTVLAESDRTIRVEGNQYFPPDSINPEYFHRSDRTSVCKWKGTANYYTIEVEGRTNPDAAWYYPAPSPAAEVMKGCIAFRKGVRVVEARNSTSEAEAPARGVLARILGRP